MEVIRHLCIATACNLFGASTFERRILIASRKQSETAQKRFYSVNYLKSLRLGVIPHWTKCHVVEIMYEEL